MESTTFKSQGANTIIADMVKFINPERVSVGDNVEFKYGVYVEAGSDIIIGDDTHFAPFCVLYGPLRIGNKCAFAAHCTFASVGHGYAEHDVPMIEQPTTAQEIVIEDNVWIGANATVIGGVRIGTGSIIGSGAVVTKDVAPFSVMGGVPARFIKQR